MRSAIVQLPEHRSLLGQRQVLRAAIRQLERADLYVAAVANMDTGEPEVRRAAGAIRSDIESLRRRVVALRLSTG